MELIPVIDLLHGVVVHARGGDRSRYAPLDSPLVRGCEPLAVAQALVGHCEAGTLYVADLDAITLQRPNLDLVAAMARALPGVRLWVDAGRSEHRLQACLGDAVDRVVGSESFTSFDAIRARLDDDAVLSLDARGAQPLGPARIFDEPANWPRRVIAMALAAVGAGRGPDLDWLGTVRHWLGALREARPDVAVYAAGGARDLHDLERLADAGAAGVLCASALHDGSIDPRAWHGRRA